MDQKKTMAIVIGVAAVVMLFVIVYAQFRKGDDMTASSNPSIQRQKVTGDTVPSAAPVAEPETPEDVAAAVDAQLAEDAKALDAEVAAETAAIDEELNSLDELDNAYDENAY